MIFLANLDPWARHLWLDTHGAHGAFQHFRIPIHFLMFRGRKGKANWPLLVRRNLFQISVKGTWFFVSLTPQVLQKFHVRILNTCYRYPPPQNSPTFFPTKPGFHLSMAGGSNRHLRRPQQVLLASQQATPEWKKTTGTSGCWEELLEFNPHHWVTPQAGPTRRWADHLPAAYSLAKKQKESIPAPTSTSRLTTLQRTASAASSKQGNACRFPALRSKCKERVDRWKPRGSFFKATRWHGDPMEDTVAKLKKHQCPPKSRLRPPSWPSNLEKAVRMLRDRRAIYNYRWWAMDILSKMA